MQLGYYHGYTEQPKNWLPTYKLSRTEPHVYVNKKEQAPSYCDRILMKNNTKDSVKCTEYQAYHDVFGSDHRPVTLSIEAIISRYAFELGQSVFKVSKF